MSKKLALIVLTSAISLSTVIIPSQSSQAQNAKGFYCDTSTGKPVTVYRNSGGGLEPWIQWTSNFFKTGGYDGLTRCREVSSRLETYRQQKQLKLITVGIMNRQRVVCTASKVDGLCEGLIFTLKPNQDAVQTLNNLLAWREGQAGISSLYESGSIPYIDVSERLQDDGAPSAPSSVNRPVENTPARGSREL